MAKYELRRAAMAAMLAIALTACGGGATNNGAGSTTPGGTQRLPACPLAALRSAKKPVDITYWHAMTPRTRTS